MDRKFATLDKLPPSLTVHATFLSCSSVLGGYCRSQCCPVGVLCNFLPSVSPPVPPGSTVDSGPGRGQRLARLALLLLPVAGSLVGQRLVNPAREGLASPGPPRQVPLPQLLVVPDRPDHPPPAPRREGHGGAGQTRKSRGPHVDTPFAALTCAPSG